MAAVKVALVTGSSKGIGRGIALGLAAAGWDVAVNYNRDEEGAGETAEAVRAAGRAAWVFQADVGRRADVERMFAGLSETAGALDLLVNNAGTQAWAPLLETTEQDWDRVIDTNLKGTFLCTQQAGRLMKDRGGAIVNIGSGASKIPYPNLGAYCASKGGIENLTAVSAVELGPLGIRVNCVAPGSIEIERTRAESPDYAATWAPLTPLRRIGSPEDIAGAVVFLASGGASFITGQTIYVDGGLWRQGPWPYKTE